MALPPQNTTFQEAVKKSQEELEKAKKAGVPLKVGTPDTVRGGSTPRSYGQSVNTDALYQGPPKGLGSIATNLKKAGMTNEQLERMVGTSSLADNKSMVGVVNDIRPDSLPDYEAFKKYQSTIPNNQFRVSASVIVPRRLPDGTVVNFNNPIQAEDYDNYLKSIGKPPTTSVDEMGILDTLTPQQKPRLPTSYTYEQALRRSAQRDVKTPEEAKLIQEALARGKNNMAESTPVTDVQKTIEERAGATTLPAGTEYVPEVQKVQEEELLTPPNPLDTTDAVSPSLVSTENLDVTVPSQQNAEKYTASTIPGTPEAVAAQGKLSSESVIGDVQGSVSKESLAQAAKGEVSEQSTVKYQLEQLFSSFEEGKPLPAWAAPAVRNVGAMMQARGLGASSMASAAVTQALMESGIPIAKADADRYGQMDMANLSNQQQAALQNAMTYAAMDKANLDARMQVAVNNAKSFLSMDLQNLNNEQKMQEIDYAGQMQALTSNQAAENSAAQFNAQSQNQIDEFFAELGAQIETGNVNRRAAQDQFNVNEKNAIAQYNASLSDARERFNSTMATQIAQSNAVWRREINTAETANQNAANQMNVQNLLGITQASLDALWQRYRDEAGWALKIAESQEQRFHEIGLLSMEIDANTDLYEMESDATFSTELGKAVLNGIFKVGTAYVKS